MLPDLSSLRVNPRYRQILGITEPQQTENRFRVPTFERVVLDDKNVGEIQLQKSFTAITGLMIHEFYQSDIVGGNEGFTMAGLDGGAPLSKGIQLWIDNNELFERHGTMAQDLRIDYDTEILNYAHWWRVITDTATYGGKKYNNFTAYIDFAKMCPPNGIDMTGNRVVKINVMSDLRAYTYIVWTFHGWRYI